ncbi:MAG: hypothetical protein NNA20_11810 [Nitrospira sp.]|nr:hypothetical protein [Nitrospira sp.]
MSYQANGIAIMDKTVFTCDFLINCYQYLLLTQQRKQMPEVSTLFPNQLLDRNWHIDFTREVSLPFGCLDLSC